MSDPQPPDPSPKPDAYAVLRNRDLRVYLTGRLIAIIGQQMFAMALGWELYERTGSALALGFVGLTQVIPMIVCTLPAGHFADLYNRKRIIVLMTLILATVNLALAGISAARAPVLLIYLCLIVSGTAKTFLWAASASFLPQLVERKDLSRAVNWSSTTFQIGSITGPALGGIVLHFTHHAAWIYGLNALAAVICALLVNRVRLHHVAVMAEKFSFKTLLTGFSFVFTNRIILGIITLDMFAVLLGGATALLPVYAKEILHVGPYGLGMLQAALPVGAILCAFTLTHRPPLQKAGRSLLWAVAQLWPRDHRVRIVAIVLAVVRHADGLRDVGQRERGGAAHAGAIAHAQRKTRPRFRRQQPLHRHLQRTGRSRIRHRRALVWPGAGEHDRHRRDDLRRVRRRGHDSRRARRGLALAGDSEIRAAGWVVKGTPLALVNYLAATQESAAAWN